MGESASEVTGLKPSAYWSALEVQQTSTGRAPMGTAASNCNATIKSNRTKETQEQATDKREDNQPLIIGLSVAGGVIFSVVAAALGWYYYSRQRQSANLKKVDLQKEANLKTVEVQKEVGTESVAHF